MQVILKMGHRDLFLLVSMPQRMEGGLAGGFRESE